ncbi:UDP-glucose/GDP-mannose dehydrogenase family protein, partial [Candidatus Saccharibacteria bacterium]|nr:UDP-glucose/GDP-mannose dehydrogenase family protein [Candidatus Saccharibacteria bacterium]
MRSKNIKNIAVIGAGYVGLSTAVVLANTGYKVSLIENNDKRLKTLKTGKSFFFEAGVNELLSYALNYKYLTITSDAHTVLDSSDIIFSCVGTPENPDGSSNLRYVYEVAELVAMQAKNNCIFVQKSTVPVGTGQKIEDIFHENGCNIKYASNPEFLREGTAIIDTLYFDRIVIGSNSKLAAKTVLDTYKSVEQKREKLANIANIKPAKNKPGKY